MIDMKINSFQISDISTNDVIFKGDNVLGNVTSYVELPSMAHETLKFNHEVTFSAEVADFSPLLAYTTDLNDSPLYIEYRIPVMVQARWHKKPRINKKWLKRYGMKKDEVIVRCNVESVSPNTNYDPVYMTEHVEYGITFSSMEYKFRQDQLRRNLKVVMR